jgi:hypothetical protein
MAAARKVHQFFGFAQALGRLGVKLVAQDGIRVTDIDVIIVKDDAERLVEPAEKCFALLRAPRVLRIAKDVDRAAVRVGEKNVAVRSYREPARLRTV